LIIENLVDPFTKLLKKFPKGLFQKTKKNNRKSPPHQALSFAPPANVEGTVTWRLLGESRVEAHSIGGCFFSRMY